MNRRSFLTNWFTRPSSGAGLAELARPVSGLEPYVPGPGNEWNAIRAGHLLRRTTFLPRWSDIAAVMAMSPSQAVDLLLDTPSQPERPGMADHVTESLEGLDVTYRNIIRAMWGADLSALKGWYTAVMENSGISIAEKMTAFWSGHFTTEFQADEDIFVLAPLLYRQNQMFRERGLGNLRDLTMAVTVDPGMLVYLGGDLNSAGRPNENYARELLELYTTGLGHYTEGDIQNAARILTGWRAARFEDQPAPNGMFKTWFRATQHDIGAKEFMGVTFPARDTTTNTEFLVQRDEVRRLIDTIFEKRSRAIAEFISRKVYRFFVYSNPSASDNAVISAMADVLIQNNFEIKPLMSALLKSAHFFDNLNVGAQIKTPMEFEVGLARQLDVENRDMPGDMERLQQEIFEPPNVSGWPGHQDWITTTTYPIRSEIAQSAITGLSDDKLVAFIKGFPDYIDPTKLTELAAAVLLPRPLSNERKATLKGKLLAGAPDYEWKDMVANSPATAARNMREMLATLVELPDFQLC